MAAVQWTFYTITKRYFDNFFTTVIFCLFHSLIFLIHYNFFKDISLTCVFEFSRLVSNTTSSKSISNMSEIVIKRCPKIKFLPKNQKDVLKAELKKSPQCGNVF